MDSDLATIIKQRDAERVDVDPLGRATASPDVYLQMMKQGVATLTASESTTDMKIIQCADLEVKYPRCLDVYDVYVPTFKRICSLISIS